MQNTARTETQMDNPDSDGFDELAEPPMAEVPRKHHMWPQIVTALREVYDPEIPVNLYELGLIYKVEIRESRFEGKYDIYVEMSLTSPGCPVAQEMPGMVQDAIIPLGIGGEVIVELVWDPPWEPLMMAETARLQLNMFG